MATRADFTHKGMASQAEHKEVSGRFELDEELLKGLVLFLQIG
jgi:hypothetical protein